MADLLWVPEAVSGTGSTHAHTKLSFAALRSLAAHTLTYHPEEPRQRANMSTSDFYLRYYVGHKGKFGHEFLEFEFRPDGE